MGIFVNNLVLEKNICILLEHYPKSSQKEVLQQLNPFYGIFEEFGNSKKFNSLFNQNFSKKKYYYDRLNLFFKNSKLINVSQNQKLPATEPSRINFISERNDFSQTNFHDLITIRRRKRRKFSSEEERRVARILKNRRTAEESRQRRIHKMRTLENFVSVSEEREKRFKEETRFIAIQGAFYFVESVLFRKRTEWLGLEIKKTF